MLCQYNDVLEQKPLRPVSAQLRQRPNPLGSKAAHICTRRHGTVNIWTESPSRLSFVARSHFVAQALQTPRPSRLGVQRLRHHQGRPYQNGWRCQAQAQEGVQLWTLPPLPSGPGTWHHLRCISADVSAGALLSVLLGWSSPPMRRRL